MLGLLAVGPVLLALGVIFHAYWLVYVGIGLVVAVVTLMIFAS